jgi:hypothetical protein
MSKHLFIAGIVISSAPAFATGESPVAYGAAATSATLVIDGKLTEPVWAEAPALGFFVPITHATPSTATRGRVRWDDKHLYVAFDAQDEDLKGTLTERDSSVYKDDVLEAFFYTSEGVKVNFEINVLGTVFDSRSGDRQHWDCEGLQVGIDLRGTLNDSTDKDEGWSMEVAIPFESFLSRIPAAGEEWRFHLARYDHSVFMAEGKELSSSAPLEARNFHRISDWSILRFEQ